MTEHIVYANPDNGNGALFCNNIRNSRAETADNAVLLSGNDNACFLCSLDNNVTVKGLDRVDIDNSCLDALLR